MSSKPLTALPEWARLHDHKRSMETLHMKAMFEADAARFERFSVSIPGLLFDYSKHKITAETKDALLDLARARDVEGRRDALFAGEAVNVSENRAALHMALRGSCDGGLEIDGENVRDFVDTTLGRMEALSDAVRSDKNITAVVNIGIGGSDLGPRMAYKALKPFANGPDLHFVSNVDGSALHQQLQRLEPENTLFIISSKTFTTLETLANAQTAKRWLSEDLGADACGQHFIAVTSNDAAAKDFGVAEARIFPMRDWVGGRYSLWGAIGLPLAIACGFDVFKALLDGAKAMDEHFANAPPERNIPVLMGMLGLWYRNFWDYRAHAVLPYSHDLSAFPIYLQQVDMESNGKGVTAGGRVVNYATGPVIFGEAGTNAQHTFMQLLHQSPEVVPADFILAAQPVHSHKNHHAALLGNALAQSKALMEGQDNTNEPHRWFPGNRPSSTLILDRLDGYHLGMLLALYEHKVFVQGAVWDVNSFDQWGVELGKRNAQRIIQSFESGTGLDDYSDSSTKGLFDHLVQKFIKS
ncbi:MAG: glucose-6-phosphate isomerase [Alphaproteobacteria bacterium]